MDPVAEIYEEADRAFDEWREQNDPLYELDIFEAAEAFCRAQTPRFPETARHWHRRSAT